MKLLPHARMAAILLWSTAAVATAQTGPRVMTNDDIIQLVKLGMSPDIVLAAIKGAGRTEFDVSPSGLTKLKEARVPDPVVVAMIGVGTTLDPNDVATPRDPGIYIDVGEGAPKLVALEPAVFSQGKSGGFLKSALTYGIAKVKWKAVVRSPAANLRTRNGQPTFYFYFENRATGLSPGAFSMIFGGATSPNEFVLAKVAVKKDSRELVVGEMGMLGGSSGARSEDTVEFQVERLSPGAYRVRPTRPLFIGEYCFFYGGGGGSAMGMGMGGPSMQRIFDFGVDGAASPSGGS